MARPWTPARFESLFGFKPGDEKAAQKFGREYGYIPHLDANNRYSRTEAKRTKADPELAALRSGRVRV